MKSIALALKDAGVKINQKTNSLQISGKTKQPGGNIVKTFSDHRIAMSMLVFGLASENEIFIDDKRMIKTSFPNFKEVFNSIGADIVNVSK